MRTIYLWRDSRVIWRRVWLNYIIVFCSTPYRRLCIYTIFLNSYGVMCTKREIAKWCADMLSVCSRHEKAALETPWLMQTPSSGRRFHCLSNTKKLYISKDGPIINLCVTLSRWYLPWGFLIALTVYQSTKTDGRKHVFACRVQDRSWKSARRDRMHVHGSCCTKT